MAFKGDYLGFTYNGIHSSDLGIVRTSNGSRFEENLLPTMQDKTVQVPGRDGSYYFGSYYTQRQFSIPFAFDSLTEEQFERLRAHFGDKKIHDLVFDEKPYKAYRAKVTGTATIKYIPFDKWTKDEKTGEAKKERIYKGEGTIQFTCYDPYAVCRVKYLDEYDEAKYPNKSEWAAASGMLTSQGDIDKLVEGSILLYNPGVKDSDFKLKINFDGGEITEGFLQLTDGEHSTLGNLGWNKIQHKGTDSYVKIDSKTNLIEGYDSKGKKSGNIYNEYITAGDFFKIPIATSSYPELETNLSNAEIEYDYYYF